MSTSDRKAHISLPGHVCSKPRPPTPPSSTTDTRRIASHRPQSYQNPPGLQAPLPIMDLHSSHSHSRQNFFSSHSSQNHPTESYHRVYILSCAHCGCFVSDRGMKAVLLLRPSITLFSTDGMPYNCGPLYPDGGDGIGYSEPVERTCDCLTQSIGCFGCGNTIGYHIICPCSRCVDSVSKHRRAANGHRWVFHYGEVTFEERCYVENEPGVYNTPTNFNHPIPSSSLTRIGSSSSSSLNLSDHHPSSQEESNGNREHELANKPDHMESYLIDFPHGAFQHNLNLNLNLPPHPSSGHHISRRSRPKHRQNHQFHLKHGDPVYWHHLVSTGERPLPTFDSPTALRSRPAR